MEKQRLTRRHSGVNPLLWLSAMVVSMLLSGCAHRPAMPDQGELARYSDDVRECRDQLDRRAANGSELDASNISLFNWNVQKKRAPSTPTSRSTLGGTPRMFGKP